MFYSSSCRICAERSPGLSSRSPHLPFTSPLKTKKMSRLTSSQTRPLFPPIPHFFTSSHTPYFHQSIDCFRRASECEHSAATALRQFQATCAELGINGRHHSTFSSTNSLMPNNHSSYQGLIYTASSSTAAPSYRAFSLRLQRGLRL